VCIGCIFTGLGNLETGELAADDAALRLPVGHRPSGCGWLIVAPGNRTDGCCSARDNPSTWVHQFVPLFLHLLKYNE
jgi:hypothetical protein